MKAGTTRNKHSNYLSERGKSNAAHAADREPTISVSPSGLSVTAVRESIHTAPGLSGQIAFSCLNVLPCAFFPWSRA
jgi:hypothetical protein